jgi:hypothetical protein
MRNPQRVTNLPLNFCHGWWCILFVAALIVGVVASPADAQQAIEVSSTPFGYECLLNNDAGPGIRTAYVQLSFNPGTTSARFMLALTPGATMTYVSESTPYSFTGNTQSGISICFGSCLEGTQVNVIATVSYMSYGTDPRCSELRVVPYPGSETVEVMNCDGTAVAAWCADLQLVPYAPFPIPCDCSGYHKFSGVPHLFGCEPVSVEAATWGRVKALYRP